MNEPTPLAPLARFERAALIVCGAVAVWFFWRVLVFVLAVATTVAFVASMLALSTPRRRSRH